VRSLAEKHLVKEQCHNLFLTEFLLNLPGKEGFRELSLYSLFASQKIVARKLLRQCTATTSGGIAGRNDARNGSQEATIVDTRVFEEATILGSDKGLYDVLWKVLISNRNTSTFANLADQIAIAAEYPQWHLQANVSNGFCGLKARLHIIISANNAGNGRDHPD